MPVDPRQIVGQVPIDPHQAMGQVKVDPHNVAEPSSGAGASSGESGVKL